MYSTGQYLWDRKTNEPVKFQGVTLSYHAHDNKARFSFITFSGVNQEFIFTKAEEWSSRFTHLVDGKLGNILA